MQSKNLETGDNRESQHFYGDSWTGTKHESYTAKDEKLKTKESLKHAAEEVAVDGYTAEHKKDKAALVLSGPLASSGPSASSGGQSGGEEDKAQLADEGPTVSAEASNPGASVEDHPVGVGHVASFQQVHKNIKIKIE